MRTPRRRHRHRHRRKTKTDRQTDIRTDKHRHRHRHTRSTRLFHSYPISILRIHPITLWTPLPLHCLPPSLLPLHFHGRARHSLFPDQRAEGKHFHLLLALSGFHPDLVLYVLAPRSSTSASPCPLLLYSQNRQKQTPPNKLTLRVPSTIPVPGGICRLPPLTSLTHTLPVPLSHRNIAFRRYRTPLSCLPRRSSVPHFQHHCFDQCHDFYILAANLFVPPP